MNYKLIEKVIDLIPSKDLKKSYKDDLSKGIYPEWNEEDCLTIANMSWHNINEEIDYFKQTVSLINDEKIKDSIEVWINELIHRGKKHRWAKHPDFIEKYVKSEVEQPLLELLYGKGWLIPLYMKYRQLLWNGATEENDAFLEFELNYGKYLEQFKALTPIEMLNKLDESIRNEIIKLNAL